MARRLTRAEVPIEETWNLDDLFPSTEAWEKALQEVERDLVTVTQYKGRLSEGPKILLAACFAQEELYRRFLIVATYASLRLSADGADPTNQEMAGRVGDLSAKLEAAISFVRSETLAMPDGTMERYFAEEPELNKFRRTIERIIEEKPNVLSPETEVALASLGEVFESPYTVYQRAKLTDMTFSPIKDEEGNELPMSFAVYEESYEDSESLTLRRNAFSSFTQGLKAYQTTIGATFATEVKKNLVISRLRRYTSATHMLLQSQEVPIEVYNNVLDVIFTELAPHMRRYANLRKRVLGLDKLLYCDIEAPLDPEYNPKMTFSEAEKLIVDALRVLGSEYAEIIETAFRDRWIDRCDNVGKSTGAFCSPVYGLHPYVLNTWADTMRGAFTLAHELGHAGHFVLSSKHQRLADAMMVSTFFVEAPSTINELLLADYVLWRNTDTRMRRWVLMGLLQTYHHNFVRHLLEGELQRRTYALAETGQTITAQTLSTVKGQILADFWGDTVEIDDGAKLTWMRQPHYYMGLYPYTYAAGLTVATAMAQDIKTQGQPAVDRWLEVLKAGGSKKPLELAQMAGVDMSKPDPIRKAIAYVGSLVDEIERTF
jgi:oligoendopeptidase F